MNRSVIYIEHNTTLNKLYLQDDRTDYLIGADMDCDVYIRGIPPISVTVISDDTLQISFNKKTFSVPQNKTFSVPQNKKHNFLSEIALTYTTEEDSYVDIYVETEPSVSFGANAKNSVILKRCDTDVTFIIMHADEEWIIRPMNGDKGKIYVNGKVCSMLQSLSFGDIIYYRNYTIVFRETHCVFYHQFAYELNNVINYSPETNRARLDYPQYKRSPRIMYNVPEGDITIPSLSAKITRDKGGLIATMIPNVLMVGATVAMGLLMPGNILMVLITAVATAGTMVGTVSKYFSDNKKHKENVQERFDYNERLLQHSRREIRTAILEQKNALINTYPTLEKDIVHIENFDMRLWEKSEDHEDFLKARIGEGSESLSFEIKYSQEDNQENEGDPQHAEAKQIVGKYSQVDGVPLGIDLKVGVTGIVGEYAAEHTLAIIGHICASHSYKDLQLVVIYSEEHEDLWGSLKWLPHTWVGKRQFKAMIKNPRTRDNVLGSIYQIMRERKAILEEKGSSAKIHFSKILFVIADMSLIYDHVIMEYLQYNCKDIGVYSIFLDKRLELLPECTVNILTVGDTRNGTILKENGIDTRRSYQPDFITADLVNRMARALAPIEHVSNVTNAIPNSVTLFELYGIRELEEYNLIGRWQDNKPFKTLAVPLGVRGKDDIVYLNLHEKAHGPHGLVAGTTGSGKSETIQSYIVSLAVNFHPYDVAFLLIDYKGGGMANLFANLPHLLGTITNLDGAQTMRALVAIKSELLRRQQVFSKYDVNHIDQYQKLFKENVADEPMPHLFLISDEFAELKSEKPEFMRELVSAARIGRSLGIHLILATQKPSGVVDDQIWSNSKFKICLKVQDAADSNEMLKTPDASVITLPGRGYLQVGNNEIYELFQSAWSGAKYKGEKQAGENIDENIYLFNDLGQAELLTQDFSKEEKKEEKQSEKVTQLDATIDYINEVFTSQNLKSVPSPWLPPLEERMFLPDVIANVDLTPKWDGMGKLEIVVGKLDQPQLQAQGNLSIDLPTEGNVAVYGASGMGKSMFLKTFALSAAINNSPDDLNFYVLDFGNNNIVALRDLPHTADVMTVDDVEKIEKFQRIIQIEIKRRKELFGVAGASNLSMYKSITGEKMPAIVIFVDNFDIVREQFEDLETVFGALTRDGQALGVYVVLGASRQGALRFNIIANIKCQLALYITDASETVGIVGRSELESEPMPGRGLVKLDNVYSFQVALPVAGEDDVEIVKNFNELTKRLYNSWDGEKVKSIPMLPETLDMDEFEKIDSVKVATDSRTLLPFALDNEFVEAVNIDLIGTDALTIVGRAQKGKANLLRIIIDAMCDKTDISVSVHIIDTPMLKLFKYKDSPNTKHYLSEDEEINAFIAELGEMLTERKEAYVEHMQSESNPLPPSEFYESYDTEVVIINGLVNFIDKVDFTEQENFAKILESAVQIGIKFIFCANTGDYSKGYDEITKAVKEISEGILLVDSEQQSVFDMGYAASKLPPLEIGEGYYVNAGDYVRIKIPEIS